MNDSKKLAKYRTFTKGDTGNPSNATGFKLSPENIKLLDDNMTLVSNILKKSDPLSEEDLKYIQSQWNPFLMQVLNAKYVTLISSFNS